MLISSTVYYYYGAYLHVPSIKELHKISVILILNKANIKQGVDFTKGCSECFTRSIVAFVAFNSTNCVIACQII